MTAGPDSTAVRVALWRALHVQVDPAPHVLADEVGLRLADPDDGWRDRPDMGVDATRLPRATVVARARFVEDLVAEQHRAGVDQYVLLGAGLDTFVQRARTTGVRVFEVDRSETQAWKRQRLTDLGLGVPDRLHLVPVDFETDGSWWKHLADNGFDPTRPAVVASTGVTMYLTKDAVAASLREIAALAAGSTLAMTFQLPLDLIADEERPMRQATENAARASGTPFVSFFAPPEILALARDAGFTDVRHVSPADLTARYFAGRADGLHPSDAEHILVATI